jgi:hypothetical protein
MTIIPLLSSPLLFFSHGHCSHPFAPSSVLLARLHLDPGITYLPTDIIFFPHIGKQARVNDETSSRKHEHSPTNAPTAPQAMAHVTEPAPATANRAVQPIPDAYSVADNNQHRVAQANDVAAHHAGETVEAAKSKSKRVEDHHVAKLVQEENESKGKFPKYPGLERYELLEKMGDGAFSNVYRARDLTGGAGECAIKVVRKYEMNNMQVSSATGG